jgi:hypothetical protein
MIIINYVGAPPLLYDYIQVFLEGRPLPQMVCPKFHVMTFGQTHKSYVCGRCKLVVCTLDSHFYCQSDGHNYELCPDCTEEAYHRDLQRKSYPYLSIPKERMFGINCPRNHPMTLMRQRPPGHAITSVAYQCDRCSSQLNSYEIPWFHCSTCATTDYKDNKDNDKDELPSEYDLCPDCIHQIYLYRFVGLARTAPVRHKHKPKRMRPKKAEEKNEAEEKKKVGPLVVVKKPLWVIVKMAIPPFTRIHMAVDEDWAWSGRKCRFNGCIVLDIQRPIKDQEISLWSTGVYDAISAIHTDTRVIYSIGGSPLPHEFSQSTNTCDAGLHGYESNNRNAVFTWIPPEHVEQ